MTQQKPNPLLETVQNAATRLWNTLAGLIQRIAAPNTLPDAAPPVAPDFTVDVVRPDDMLLVTFGFANMRLIKGNLKSLPRLVQYQDGDCFISLTLPPQALGEEINPKGTANARLTESSVLVFRVAPSLFPLPFTLDDLLAACEQSEPVAQAGMAAPIGRTTLQERLPLEMAQGTFTAIEAPYRIVLSPSGGRWHHAPTRPSPNGRVALWHTRLHNPDGTARAVWSPDLARPDAPTLFNTIHTPKTRAELVRLSSDQRVWPPNVQNPPLNVEELILSAAGATLRANFTLPEARPRPGFSLTRWDHSLTLGRDDGVISATPGYLMPFGHPALLVQAPARALRGERAALVTQFFVAPRAATVRYHRRDIPFSEVTLLTRRSAEIVPGEGAAYWAAHADGQPVQFRYSALDHAGNRVEFSAPAIFFSERLTDPTAGPLNELKALIERYNDDSAEGLTRRTLDLNGQQLAFARPNHPGDTTLSTLKLTLSAAFLFEPPYFGPTMTAAQVVLPAVAGLYGATLPPLRIVWEESYATQPDPAIFGNAGEVYARLEQPLPLTFRDGFAPSFLVEGLSRRFGPIGNLEHMRDGLFSPARIYSGVRFFGLNLREIVGSATVEQCPPDRVECGPIPTARQTPGVETTYRWRAGKMNLRETGTFMPDEDGEFTYESRTRYGQAAGRIFSAALTNFTLTPGENQGLAALMIRRLALTHEGAELSIIRLVLKGNIAIAAALVNTLPLESLSRLAGLSRGPDGLRGAVTALTPMLGIGGMSAPYTLGGVTLALPTSDGPFTLHFDVGHADDPALLTNGTAAGSLSLQLSVGADGVGAAALVVGVAGPMSLTFGGVVGGAASVRGSFSVTKPAQGEVSVNGALHVSGLIEAGGLISASVTFNLPIVATNNGFVGRGLVTLHPDLGIFEAPVTLTVHRALTGNPPTAAESISELEYESYWAAFAQ